MDTAELSRHARTTLGVVVLSGLAVLGAVWLGTAVELARQPLTCGWGCSPDAATSVVLVGIIVVVPAVALSALVLGVGVLVARRRPAATSWVRGGSLALRWLAGALALAAVGAAGASALG